MLKTTTIRDLLNKIAPIYFDQALVNKINKFCITFETRNQHAMALNSPYLGVHKCVFTPSDQQEFFDLFDIDSKELDLQFSTKEMSHFILGITQQAMRKELIKLDAVDASRKVQSDVFNIFITYVMYKAKSCKLPDRVKNMTVLTLFKIFQYRFWTSLVQHRFGYGCDVAIMKATVDNLSQKYDITRYGTWKAVMEARANELTSSKSIHYHTLTSYDSDIGILYLISDVQTRIRSQCQGVTNAYYLAKENGDKIREYGLVGNDLEGTKMIMSQISTFDSMVTNVVNEMMSVHQFIEPPYVSTVCKMYSNLRPDMFKTVLVRLSAMALAQSKFSPMTDMKHSLDYTRTTSTGTEYIGMRALVSNIIQKTYRYCIVNKVNINSKLDILKTTRDIYSSSRISDPHIVDIRNSMDILVGKCNVSKRAATVASLKIGIVVYFIIKTFKHM